jgi:hypothetical protein
MLAGVSATITNTVLSFTTKSTTEGVYEPEWLAHKLFDKKVADEMLRFVCDHH